MTRGVDDHRSGGLLRDLAARVVSDAGLLSELRAVLKQVDERVALDTCKGIIDSYHDHGNFFVAVMVSDEIVLRNGTCYLPALRALRDATRHAGGQLPHYLKQHLEMNQELLELEAETDMDAITGKCTCLIYSKHGAHPGACLDIEIIAMNRHAEAMIECVDQHVRCTRCARRWVVTIAELSAPGSSITWSFDD